MSDSSTQIEISIPSIPFEQAKFLYIFSLTACIALTLGILIAISGCESLSYYTSAARGHLAIQDQKRPIEEAMADETLDETTRARLHTVRSILNFAHNEVKLETKNQYSTYADIGRDYVTWNVFAAPPLELTPHYWCYLVIGCQAYRGYFSHEDAVELAADLANDGMDVFIAPVDAYSTLGYFEDPILSTFITRQRPWLAELIFHELTHTKVYVEHDSTFNEGLASGVAILATTAWLGEDLNYEAQGLYLDYQRRVQQKVAQYSTLKQQLDELYAKNIVDEEYKLNEKSRLIEAAHRQSPLFIVPDNVPLSVQPYQRPNNALLTLNNTYTDQVAATIHLFAAHNCDWEAFWTAVQRLAKLPRERRDQSMAMFHIGGHSTSPQCKPFRGAIQAYAPQQ